MKIRLYISDRLTTGEINLSEDQSHYIAKVLRIKPNTTLYLFNENSGEWRATARAIHPKKTKVFLEACVREPIEKQGLTLAFAPIKRSRIGTLFAMATELGVDYLQPVRTQFTNARLENPERIARQLMESCEQCERLSPPICKPIIDFSHFITRTQHKTSPFMACLESGQALSMKEIFHHNQKSSPARTIFIGPEGGFSPKEITQLEQTPHCICINLGPRILRSETACATALAQWQAFFGDHQQRPY